MQTYLEKHRLQSRIVPNGDDDELCIYFLGGDSCKIEIHIGYPKTGEREAVTMLALSPATVSKEKLVDLFNLTNHINRINQNVTMLVGPSNGSYWARHIFYPLEESFDEHLLKVEGLLCSIIDQTFPAVMKIEHEGLDFVTAWTSMNKKNNSENAQIDTSYNPDMFG